MSVYDRMKQLGISLPKPSTKLGAYAQAKEFGDV